MGRRRSELGRRPSWAVRPITRHSPNLLKVILMNTIHLHGIQPVAIDSADIATRLALLELSSYARTNASGEAKFVDSAGVKHVLDAGEILELASTAHRAIHAGTSK